MQEGRVIKAYNSFYYVQAGEAMVTCRLRGNLKKKQCNITAGDFVAFEILPDQSGVIEKRLPRTNVLQRPVVANIDQVVLTFAAVQPDLHPLLLNRFLVLSEWSGIPDIVICINKIELLPEEQQHDFLTAYEAVGYSVLRVSARENRGIDDLRQRLDNKVTVFAGPSGVGKSTLLNAIDEKLMLTTGKISDKIKRGRHTTRIAQLLPFAGGFIADTPGFSSIALENIEKEALAGFFPEFRPFLGECRYNTCTHSHEPQCAVKQAVEEGTISTERYEAYLAILKEIKERKKEYE